MALNGHSQVCPSFGFEKKDWNWSLNIGAGFTSYFGDVSYYDVDGWKKITKESGPATDIFLTYYFNDWAGISGQVIIGRIQGGNNADNIFRTELFTYNLIGELDLIKLSFPESDFKFGIRPFAGIGQMLFDCFKFRYENDITTTVVTKSRVPEFVFFFGEEIYYKLNYNIALISRLSIHQLQNDKLDNLVMHNDFDYYSFFSIGMSYYFSTQSGIQVRNISGKSHRK
jgi:hypothetical protein